MKKGKKKEIQVEKHIRSIIKKIIKDNDHFTLLDSKDVFDIVICENNTPKLFFIEVKYYTGRKSRIGFGNRYGKGFQPEILSRRPEYFEENLIWVFQREDDTNYYVLKNADCKKYIMGTGIGDKQNNFRYKDLFKNEKSLTEDAFVQYLEDWLSP